MYRHPAVLELTNAAQSVVGTLAEAYLAAPERMPEEWGGELPAGQQDRARQVGDFISGMTDRYALARYRELTGKPSPLPDGFLHCGFAANRSEGRRVGTECGRTVKCRWCP